MPLPPASGTGRYFARAAKSIRLIRQGCTNRPFYHISVTHVSTATSLYIINNLFLKIKLSNLMKNLLLNL